jgi:DNA polymerase-3 subunit alpha
MQSGAATAADRRRGQLGLFGQEVEEPQQARAANLPDIPAWDQRERMAKEREVLGFYLSSHPLAEHEETLAPYCSHTTAEAAELPHRTEVMLGGMISAIKLAHTKNPKPGSPSRYAMFDLEDTAGSLRCILWPEPFARYGHLVQPDAILVVRGAVDKRPGSEEANLILSELIPLENLASRYTRGVLIRVEEDAGGPRKLEVLHEILRGYPGDGELQLLICLSDGSRVPCRCDDFHVAFSAEMRSRVDELLGPGNLRLLTAAGAAGRGNGWR